MNRVARNLAWVALVTAGPDLARADDAGEERSACHPIPDPRKAALLSDAQGIARPAPPAGLGVAQSLRSPERNRHDRVHVGGWYVFGRLLRLRRAPQGQADEGGVQGAD